MKRIFALLLACLMLFALAACSGESENPQGGIGSGEGQQPQGTQSANPSEDEIAFAEQVVVDNDACSIKITGIDPENLFGYTLNVQLENKSAETTYMFALESAAVNGVMCAPLFASEVTAGNKANESITFMDPELEENGIDTYTDIELSFRVYDSNDWMAEPVATETVSVYPYGQENATQFVREAQEKDNVIVDNDYVTVIVTGYEQDEIWGYTANLFLVNKTDKEVMFTADDVAVNGFMVDPFYAESVGGGKCAFSAMTWLDTTLAENSITAVEKIEATFRAYDAADWGAEDLANQTVTLIP